MSYVIVRSHRKDAKQPRWTASCFLLDTLPRHSGAYFAQHERKGPIAKVSKPVLSLSKGEPKSKVAFLNEYISIHSSGNCCIGTQNGTLSLDRKRPAVIIKVQDSGPGIPLDQQKNIFNPFFTTKHTGTGLGLAISHRIVSRHRGLISFESVPDEGTTFTVELPAAPVR